MTFVETYKTRWKNGTFIVKTRVARYHDTDLITYEYTVRKNNMPIERNTTNKFGEVIKRLLYYKGL